MPWFSDARKLPAEDALGLEDGTGKGEVTIVVPVISRIANFDDLDPLRLEPGVSLRLVQPGDPLPGDADVVLLPGSKSTVGDLAFLRCQGWDVDLAAHVRRGGRVVGICGGYQMLGRTISDPDGIEGPAGTVQGLGLLDVETVLTPEKRLVEVTGAHATSGTQLSGYEIHIGRTQGADCARPFAHVTSGGSPDHPDGAISANGRISGTYLHGLFTSDEFRAGFLKTFGAGSSLAYSGEIDATLDALAVHLESCMDIEAILEIAQR